MRDSGYTSNDSDAISQALSLRGSNAIGALIPGIPFLQLDPFGDSIAFPSREGIHFINRKGGGGEEVGYGR
jgi:hypothetical protein